MMISSDYRNILQILKFCKKNNYLHVSFEQKIPTHGVQRRMISVDNFLYF